MTGCLGDVDISKKNHLSDIDVIDIEPHQMYGIIQN